MVQRRMFQWAIAVAGVLALAVPATSPAQQQGDWHLGGRVIFIDVDDARSEPVGDTASRITFDSATSLELDSTYLLGHNWGVELMVTTADHDLGAIAGDFDGLDLGSVWIAQSTLTLRYIVPLYGRWRPYVGAGIGAAYLHDYDGTDEAAGASVTSVQSDLGVGFVGQIGLMHRLDRSWFLTLDLKWSQLPIDVEVKGPLGTIDTVETDLDPFIIGLGAAFRF